MKILVAWRKYLYCWPAVNSSGFQEELYSMLLTITFFPERCDPQWAKRSSLSRFTISLRHSTLGWTPLDEWSDRRRFLYVPTHNNHRRQTSTTPGGIRSHNPNKRAAIDPRLRPRGNCDRQIIVGFPVGPGVQQNEEERYPLLMWYFVRIVTGARNIAEQAFWCFVSYCNLGISSTLKKVYRFPPCPAHC